MNEFQNLRKSPGHTHGIADQRFSKIATYILKVIVHTISLMHDMVINSFKNSRSQSGLAVKTSDCPGSIDFDKLLKPCFSPELNKGGYGSHPHPTDGEDWTKAAGCFDTGHISACLLTCVCCGCRSQSENHPLCACVLGTNRQGSPDAIQVIIVA